MTQVGGNRTKVETDNNEGERMEKTMTTLRKGGMMRGLGDFNNTCGGGGVTM